MKIKYSYLIVTMMLVSGIFMFLSPTWGLYMMGLTIVETIVLADEE